MLYRAKETILYVPNTSIGIIGLGIVGTAISESYENNSLVRKIKIDIDPTRGSLDYKSLENSDGVFICVPSPVQSNGEYNVSILYSVLEKLQNYRGVIISKVTATPDIYKELEKQYPNLVYCPEFLTANSAINDYAKTKFFILGGSIPAYTREAERIIKGGFRSDQIEFHHCTIEEAAVAKLSINTFLASKVVFMNELYQLCEANNIKYNNVIQLMMLDKRIGVSHMHVPGPDGSFGFGGMCFPKDTQAFLRFAENSNVDFSMLETALKKNTLLRLK